MIKRNYNRKKKFSAKKSVKRTEIQAFLYNVYEEFKQEVSNLKYRIGIFITGNLNFFLKKSLALEENVIPFVGKKAF